MNVRCGFYLSVCTGKHVAWDTNVYYRWIIISCKYLAIGWVVTIMVDR